MYTESTSFEREKLLKVLKLVEVQKSSGAIGRKVVQ